MASTLARQTVEIRAGAEATPIPPEGRYCPRCESEREPTGGQRSEGHVAVRLDNCGRPGRYVRVFLNGAHRGAVYEAEGGPDGWLVADVLPIQRCPRCWLAYVREVVHGDVRIEAEPVPIERAMAIRAGDRARGRG